MHGKVKFGLYIPALVSILTPSKVIQAKRHC